MTKQILKEKYQNWKNEIMNDNYNDTSLAELQDLNVAKGDGQSWCSPSMCLQGIIKGGDSKAINLGFMIYNRNVEIEVRVDCITEIARATDDMNI